MDGVQIPVFVTSGATEEIKFPSKTANYLASLDKVRVSYKVPYGHPPRILEGQGCLLVRIEGEALLMSILGDVSRPSAVEFSFHRFFLTRYLIESLIRSLAEGRSASDQYIATPHILPLSPATAKQIASAQALLKARALKER